MAAQHQQMPEAAAAHPVKIAGGHPIQGHGDQTDVVLGQHPGEELAEALRVQGHVPQQGGALLQGGDHQLPELPVLPGQLLLAVRLQGGGAILQLLRQPQLLQQPGEGGGLPCGVFRQTAAPGKMQQRLRHPAAQGVDLGQARFGLGRILRAVALRVLAPVLLPCPGAAPELPFINVVGEPVALLRSQTREPGAQVADHVVHVPAGAGNLVGEGDQRREGLGEQLVFPCHKEGNAVVLEDVFQGALIILKAPYSHGDVPPAAAPVPHQRQDPGGSGLALGRDALGAAQADAGGVPFKGALPVAEELLGEKAQGGGLAPPGLRLLHGDLLAQLLRGGIEPPEGGAAEGKDLVLAVRVVQSQADRELHPPAQHGHKHRQLLVGEVQEAVHIDPILRAQGALLNLLRQQLQPVGGVGVTVGHHRVIGLQNQRQILQLLPQPVGAALRRLRQLRGADAGALQLVHGAKQHGLQLRPVPCGGVDLQPGAHGAQRQGHAEEPAPLVQQRRRQTALFLPDAPGKAGEAEHLRREGEGVPADAAKFPLGLMAVLLRHQQVAAVLPPLHRLPQLLIDRGGLAGSGFSDDEAQHVPRPLP